MADLFLDNPWWLLGLAIVPAVLWLRSRQPVATLVIPFAGVWYKPTLLPPSRLPALLMSAGLVVLVLALARPQRMETYSETKQEGHNLMLAIDLSGSMLAEDFEKDGERINRLQVIKPVIQAFINDRPNDRIGLVVFAGKAYTLAPPTFDHAWLGQQIEKLRVGLMEDGTAIGDGLGVALARLEHTTGEEKPAHTNDVATTDDRKKQSAASATPPQSKGFIVLLTDGSSNKGLLTPMQSAAIAKSRGVTVYTIGAGKEGSAPYPVFDEMGNKMGYRRILTDIDEKALRDIAQLTGGQYFRADNTAAVATSFKAIDASQRTKFEAKAQRPRDFFTWFLAVAVGLVLWGALLARPPLRQDVTA